MATYLVTGGAGFIGSHLAEELVKRGEKVRVIDNFFSGKAENMASFINDIEFYEGDIRDALLVEKAMKGVDYVLHHAAVASVPRSVENPEESTAVNVAGTLNVLRRAAEQKVRRLVYAGSSSAYGNSGAPVKSEAELPDPISPYAVTKLAGEYYCRSFAAIYGLETVVLRYFNVFGERQDPNSLYSAVIPLFCAAAKEKRRATIFGTGEQTRDFTYVKNNVEANMLAAKAEGISGQVFNIACGQTISLLELHAAINRIMGTDLEPVMAPPRIGDVMHSSADITKARKLLGYEPGFTFEEGLKKTCAFFGRD
ncbi:SDR family oxidoreductase [bacterium]|nr:SDR family oxidoreductase [bacterium]